jgi:hypothetical protein
MSDDEDDELSSLSESDSGPYEEMWDHVKKKNQTYYDDDEVEKLWDEKFKHPLQEQSHVPDLNFPTYLVAKLNFIPWWPKEGTSKNMLKRMAGRSGATCRHGECGDCKKAMGRFQVR